MSKGVGHCVSIAFIIAIMLVLAPKTDTRATLGFSAIQTFILLLFLRVQIRDLEFGIKKEIAMSFNG
jgi:hypothetical protein